MSNKTKKCKHDWRYEHGIYTKERGQRDITVRICADCGQWSEGTIRWRNVKECPVDPVPEVVKSFKP